LVTCNDRDYALSCGLKFTQKSKHAPFQHIQKVKVNKATHPLVFVPEGLARRIPS